jgi:prophage maintenance system killer protein
LRRPTLALAVAINTAVRAPDEWFNEADETDRVQRALSSIEGISDPITAAAVLAFRIARAQAFAEGNKRTALLLARWLLDHNGFDGSLVLPSDDFDVADLLIKAAAGADVEREMIALLASRS